MSLRIKAIIAIIIAAILWSAAGTVGKILVREAHPFVIAFYRFGLATLILLPWFLKEKKSIQSIRNLLPLGIFNALNILFYYSGLALTTANAAVIIGTTVPIITLLLSNLIIHEPITKQKLIGIVVGLFGAILVVVFPLFEKGQMVGGTIMGNMLIYAAVVSWTLYIIFSKSAGSKKSYSPIMATFINLLVTTIASGAAALITHQNFSIQSFEKPYYLSTYLYSVFGITILTFFLFQWAIRYVSATTASMKEYLQLLGGITINIIVLHESLTFTYAVGAFLVCIGVYFATRGALVQSRTAITASGGPRSIH